MKAQETTLADYVLNRYITAHEEGKTARDCERVAVSILRGMISVLDFSRDNPARYQVSLSRTMYLIRLHKAWRIVAGIRLREELEMEDESSEQ